MAAVDKRYAALRMLAGITYFGTILWVAIHPSGHQGDVLNFKENTAHAIAATACMVLTVALFLVGSRGSSRSATTRFGCVGCLIAFVVAPIAGLVAAFTIIPESWSDQDFQYFIGNLIVVATVPGFAIWAFAFRICRPTWFDR